MKTRHSAARWLALITLFILNLQLSTTFAQGTAFAYQGRLDADGSPASGFYDLQFTVYDALAAGNALGGPLLNSATSVSNGLFVVQLDFGDGVFTGSNRWLEIAVRTNGAASFAKLTPRQPLAAAPYAILAGAAGGLRGTLPASQVSGVVPLAQLPTAVMTNYATGVSLSGYFIGSFDGSFFGNGSGLTGLSPANLSAGTAAINISGNAAGATNLIGNVSDSQLPASLARLNGTNTFADTNIFAGVTIATNVNNLINGSFTGNGAGLTGLNGTNLQAGTVPGSALQPGSSLPAMDASALTSLNGANVQAGTIDASALMVSPYVATALAANNAFDPNTLMVTPDSANSVNRFGMTNTLHKIASSQRINVMLFGSGFAQNGIFDQVIFNLTNYLPFAGYNYPWCYPDFYYYTSGGARFVNPIGGDTNWLYSYIILTNNTGMITYTLGTSRIDPSFVSDTFGVAYLANPNGGTFAIQTNINGGAWTTVPGLSAVNGQNASFLGKVVAWNNPGGPAKVGIQIVNNGNWTNYIINPSWINSQKTNGFVVSIYSQVGLGYNSLTQVPANNFGPILANWSPDLVLHIGSNSLTTAFWKYWVPQADVVYASEFPHPNPEQTAQSLLNNTLNRSNAIANHLPFFDGYSPFLSACGGNPANMQTFGYMQPDGSHLMPAGYKLYGQWLWNWLGLFQYPDLHEGSSIVGPVALAMTAASITGPTNTPPVNTTTPVAWMNFTNSSGGVFKIPLYQ